MLGIKCFKAFPLLAMKISLLEYFAAVSAKWFPLLSCSVAPTKEFALLEIIEFDDSYKAHQEEAASERSAKKKGRTVVITTEDMQKKRNDVKPPKKTKKNQLKQQYGNFKPKGSETLKQTFNRLQAIVSHLEFIDVEIEQDDLKQKFLTSLAPEWLMYTIVWRNRDDLDTMTNTNSGKSKVHTTSVPTASTQVFTTSVDVAAANISHDTKKTGKKITIQGTDVAGFDKSKVECFNFHKMSHFARECRAPRSQDRGRRESYKQGFREEEPAPKALMAIDRIGWDWSYMANEEENHALVADDKAPTEFALMAKSSSSFENEIEARLVEFKTQEIKFCEKIRGLKIDVEFKNNKIEYLMNELEQVKKEKEGLDSKLTGFESALKDLDTLLGSQRNNKNKEGLGYSAVPPLLLKPSPSIESNTSDLQNSNSSVSEHGESSSSIMSKPMIKFVKAADSPTVIKTNKVETIRKSSVKYVEMYRNTSKSPKVRGNQRNWNNLKSQQLGKDFLMKNKARFKCGYFDQLAYDCGVWVEKGKTWTKNNFAHKNVKPIADLLKTSKTPIAVNRTNMNVAQPKRTPFAKTTHSYSTFTADLGNKGKVVKASACWIWRPKQNTTDKGYWDSGCSRHMTGNISYLSEYEPYDEGYVSFGQGGGKITGKEFIIMSNTNNNMQTQMSNTLHNAIMEVGSKDRPPMLAPGSPITRTKRVHETYKNVSQEIRDQLNTEAEAVQIILTGIDNDIYSTVDACPNVCKMWKAIERLKHGESINVQDLETNLYWEFGKFTSQDEWKRFVTLVKQSQELKTVSYHKLYDILKQHQQEFNKIRAKKIARVANPFALVTQQQPVYNP
nr:ribonuclease H-like domain-containing protein [Tanacetum cinerariifolium]